jgi:membrane protease YdiL (CAAX protease family)
MRPDPLIAEAGTYGVAVLLIMSLSGFSLASHIHSRLQNQRIPFLAVYCMVLAFITIGGVLVLDPARWFDGGVMAWVIAAGAGPVLSVGATWADKRIVRSIERRRRLNRRGPLKPVPADLWYSLGPFQTSGSGPGAKRRRAPLTSVRRPDTVSMEVNRVLRIALIVIVGALEEILYRAILVQLCFLLRNPILVAVALCATVVMFCLSHIEFGWTQVFAKLPLGALALLATLATGNVSCAMIAHGLFNMIAATTNRGETVSSTMIVSPWRRA